MESINERINIVVQESKLTKTAFAKRINISQAMVSMLCAGSTSPSDRTIMDICREFRICEEWLRTGNGDMKIVDTEREKLQRFFADVLATAPDERSAFVAALADLPDDFWPVVDSLIRSYTKNYGTKKED